MNKLFVLVVEDDAPVRNLITVTLKSHDYKFITAAGGENAVMQASSHNPDVILLALGLPDIDGVEVIKIGGHSIGSCIVEVDAGEKTYVITGDECYSRRCLDEHICAGAPYSVENNQKFIEKYSDTDKYVSLVSHDPDYQSEYKVPYSE